MFYKSFPLLVISLWGVIVLPLPNRVSAITPLMRAEIQNIRNIVQLVPKDRYKKRPARKSDAMTPGDGLSTGRASLAELRFNDGSLARVGEQAIFQFLPKTRSFRLSNGTALLLIPPGRGQTRIQTPSAAAAIRGSALFVRYNKETDTTIVGALTNSGIEVFNQDASQSQVLQAGQMMLIVKGKFQGLYDFDLRNFYKTSDMVRGLDLTRENLTPTADPAIASVQAETAAALKAQSPIIGEGVVENPSFTELTTSSSASSSNDIITGNSPVDAITDNSPLNSFEDIGQLLSNTKQRSVINGNNNNVNTQNNNVGVDSSKIPTTLQNPSVQPTPGVDLGTPTTNPTQPTPGVDLGTPTTNPTQPTPGGDLGTPTTNPTQPTPGGDSGTPITHPTQPTPGGDSGTPITHPTQPTPGGDSGTPITHPTQPTPGDHSGTPITHPTQPTPGDHSGIPNRNPRQPTPGDHLGTPNRNPRQPTPGDHLGTPNRNPTGLGTN